MRNQFLHLVAFIMVFSGLNLANADQVQLLISDSDAIQARIHLIKSAKKEVFVEYYSIWNDDYSIAFLGLLADAAQRGVKVKLVMDALSNSVPRSVLAHLLLNALDSKGHPNFEVKLYNPLSLNLRKLTHRNHSKLVAIDGEFMISGGRNVGGKYFGAGKRRNYKDLDILARGEIAIKARSNFLVVWNSLTVAPTQLFEYAPDKLLENACAFELDQYDFCEVQRAKAKEEILKQSLRFQKLMRDFGSFQFKENSSFTIEQYSSTSDLAEATSIELLSHEPDQLVTRHSNTMTSQLKNYLLSARSEVVLVSPYVIPTDEVYAVFESLLARHVRIKIFTNSLNSTDNLFAQAGYRAEKQKMTQMGVEIYEFNGPETLHAKAALVDNHLALVGTFNLDPRSMNLNREIGLAITGSEIINQQLRQTFLEYESHSTLVGINGAEQNRHLEYFGVSDAKRALLKAISMFLPFIKNQL